MHLYTWKKEYSLDVEELDLQHKNLLAMINKLIMFQNESKAIVRRLIDEVIAYAEFHFLSEDNIMMITHYDGFEQNQKVHKMLLKKLRNQYTHYVNGQIELKEIIVFMARWLIDHIIAEQNDRALARYLRSSDKYRNLLTLENSN